MRRAFGAGCGFGGQGATGLGAAGLGTAGLGTAGLGTADLGTADLGTADLGAAGLGADAAARPQKTAPWPRSERRGPKTGERIRRADRPKQMAAENDSAYAASMSAPAIAVRRLPHNPDLPLPAYETPLSAGQDLRAALAEPKTLAPGDRALIPTGLAMAIPAGFEVQIRPRSGLAFKHGVTCLNTPGTIDADYRGEVKVLLVNLGSEPFTIRRGDRIAQMVIAPVVQAQWKEMDALDETARGSGGFGSTGTS